MVKLKCAWLLIIFFSFSAAVIGQDGTSPEVLTNDKIRLSTTNFNTSTDELIQLQAAKVPFETYSCFEIKNSGLSSNNYYATSPNEFVLVSLDVKNNTGGPHRLPDIKRMRVS